ncbi:hypothetical protein [Mycobacterium sp. E740]|uniref:hypothetical protein n=1 Tax=Mycobacterium sp. E740 TaxID=1834149 RepID=UPI0007FBCFA9|nr:hypothetical protein [Mycobacterium sp. E740]OBI76924.1 hypothetical protein A5663_02515 [Mycobacterium sp. E740]
MSKRHHRLAYTGIIAGVVLIIALLAMNFPVFLDSYDQYGWQIKCGTGYFSDLAQAAATVGEHNYVDQCQTALLLRRLWTIPLAVLAGAVLLAVLVASATTSARESLQPHHNAA